MKKTFIKNIVATVVFVALVGFSYGQTNQVQEKEKNESSNEECSPCEEARKSNGGEKAVEYLVPVNISPAEKDKRQINYDGVIQNSKSIDITEEERILQEQIRNREKRYEEDAKQKAEALKREQTKQKERNAQLQPSKLNAPKWEKGGIFEGYTPEQENISLRTQNSKKFINPDGSITAQIGGNYHYKDQEESWKDIDFTIVPSNESGFAYQNTTNTIKSYFPQEAGQKGVQLKSEKFDFSFWKSPELLVVDASKNTVYQENRIGNLLSVSGEIAHYQSFNNVVDEFKIIDYGIENNIIINQFNENWGVNGAKTVSFKQFIELPYGTKIIDINGTQKTTDFSSELFVLEFPSGEKVFFNPLITFDNNTNKEEAKLFYGIEENKVPEEIKAKTSSFYKGNYRIAFVEGGIEIYADVDLNWLKNAQFPVVVDPTVTVGSTVSGSFYGPMTHWYGYQRHATLYLQSEIGGYGTITQIDYYKTNTAATRTKPTSVYMRNNSATMLTSTANWNSTTYISGATTCMNNVNTTQDATVGWKALPLTTSHNYSTGNLQIMVKDIYGGSGSSQYMAQQYLSNRQTYRRADSSDPGDGSNMIAESNFATVRITYTPAASTDPCTNVTTMACGTTYTATLSPNSGYWTNYTGTGFTYTGSEKVWSFTPPVTGPYTFNVNEGTADADFFLMDACSNTAGNLSSGYWIGNSPGTSHTVTLTGGVTYYLIADLYSFASSATTVTVSVDCPSNTGDDIIPTACATATYTLQPNSTIHFYDDGGPGGECFTQGAPGNYANSNCITMTTICAAPGQFLIVDFLALSMMNTISGFDWLVIYDGPGTSGPQLFNNRAGQADNDRGSYCYFYDNNDALSLCSTSQCLTFEFFASSTVDLEGWDALVSSVPIQCSPLPVELSHFSANCDKHVILSWATESELNSEKFIVEKSRNGVNWELVDELAAAGNSNSHLAYSLTDYNPNNGISYYRLRQVDFDGKEKIYGPISVSCTYDGNSINVYPNPNNGNFTVEINSPSDIEEASLQLLAVTGKLIASREFQIVDGVTQIMIEETQSLKPGTYVLKVIADVYFEPVKIVVK